MAKEEEVVFRFKADTGQVTEALEETQDALEQTKKKGSSAFSALDKATGGLASKVTGAIASLRGMVSGMKMLNAVVAASGIGLLLTAVAGLRAAFTSSEEGQNKFAKIMGVIGSVTDNLVDLLADFGEMIISAFENPKEAVSSFAKLVKENITNRFEGLFELLPKIGEAIGLLFEGKFSAAGKVAADAIGKVALGVESVTDVVANATEKVVSFGEEVASEAEQAAKVADMRARADKIERELLVQRARQEAEIAELRLKARQEDLYTADERKAFLQEALEGQDALLKKETEYLQLRADAQSLENTFARSTKEALDAEAQAIAAVEQVAVNRLNQQRTFQREFNTLNAQIEAANAARKKEDEERAKAEAEKLAATLKTQQEALAAEEARYQKITEAFQTKEQNEVDAVMRKYDELFLLAEEFGYDTAALTDQQEAEQAAIRAKYRAEEEKARNAELEAERAKNRARVTMATNVLGALIALNDAFVQDGDESARKQFNRQKALNIGLATINTALAVADALAKDATFPGSRFIAAASAGAVGAAQIATIRRQEFGASASTTLPSVSAPTSNTPTPPNAPQIDLGFLGNGAGQTGFRAYVVNTDISNSLQAQQLIEEQANLSQ